MLTAFVWISTLYLIYYVVWKVIKPAIFWTADQATGISEGTHWGWRVFGGIVLGGIFLADGHMGTWMVVAAALLGALCAPLAAIGCAIFVIDVLATLAGCLQ